MQEVYYGNGDSSDFGISQKQITYNYPKPGKYNVKLKAFYKSGAWSWYSDSVDVRSTPSAYFTNQTSQGCQYIAFQFLDSSKLFQLRQDSLASHRWLFGDSSSIIWQSSNKDERRNQNHIYKKDGFYTVSYIVSDGYCSDTFRRINEVKILQAPQPGILASPINGCAPLRVQISTKNKDKVDSIKWISSNHYSSTKFLQKSTEFIFNTPGNFKIYQSQYGPTGCIIRDTISIEVMQGVDTALIPQVIKATVTSNNEVLIAWYSISNAINYELWRNNELITTLTDTIYIDKQVNTGIFSYKYFIKAFDICDRKTKNSNNTQTILLKSNIVNDNICVLHWNPYLSWQNGVQFYQIVYLNNNNQIIYNSMDSSYPDKDFFLDGLTQKCYKIIAVENKGNMAQSESNELCIPYQPIIWIPSALTVNGDGLNETLKLHTYGIKSYTITIFNKWGGKVYESSNLEDEWQPQPTQQGVYMYSVKIVANDKEFFTTGTITVLR